MMDGCLVSGPQEPELVTQTSYRPFRRPDIVTIATGHHSRYVATRDAQLGNARESLANNKNHDENFFATIVQVRCDLHVSYRSTTLHPSADDTTIVKLCFSWPTGSGVISGGSRRFG